MAIYNGYFEVVIKEIEGTFLKIYPKKGEGKDVELEEIVNYLNHKNLKDFNLEAIKNALRKLDQEIEIKISDETIEAIDESVEIHITANKLEAFIRFYPPVGSGKILSREDIIFALDQKNIIFGVDANRIDDILNAKEYYKDYLIAQGQSAIQGQDAVITYYFSTDLNNKPKMNEDGSVDFHQLNVISKVKKEDLLAELSLEVEGEPGMDVHGNPVKPRKVKKLRLSYGKNTFASESHLKVYSETDGFVKLEEGKVVVYNEYEVPADVDSSTGDIEFNGAVTVRGNVRTGYTIKAKGDIEVYGVVEGATLISGGQVVLRRGIQGMGKGSIEAKGNVITKFIENSYVRSGGYIHSEAILHSQVIAKGEIVVNGKKGMLTGGEVRSGVEIQTNILGSHMGTVTNVEVGVDPNLVDEYNELSKEIQQMKEEINKMDQIINLLKKRREKGELDQEKVEMLQKATRNKIFLDNKIMKSNKRFDEIVDELDNKNIGKIKVQKVVYPGVRVTIGNIRYYVREEVKNCILYRDGADIKFRNYA